MAYRYEELVKALEAAVLDGPGRLPPTLRRAIASRGQVPDIMRAYLDKVHERAYAVTDEDVLRLREAGYGDDAIYEATVSAALGAGLARLRSGLRALVGES